MQEVGMFYCNIQEIGLSAYAVVNAGTGQEVSRVIHFMKAAILITVQLVPELVRPGLVTPPRYTTHWLIPALGTGTKS